MLVWIPNEDVGNEGIPPSECSSVLYLLAVESSVRKLFILNVESSIFKIITDKYGFNSFIVRGKVLPYHFYILTVEESNSFPARVNYWLLRFVRGNV